MEIITKSTDETKKLGEKIGTRLTSNSKATILALSGDLGSGKTTFVQGLAKGLGVTDRIISPTFILLRQYKIEVGKFKTLNHIDLYRLEEDVEGELVNLGFRELINDPANIVVIEWAEKAKGVVPDSAEWLKFSAIGEDRVIQFDGQLV